MYLMVNAASSLVMSDNVAFLLVLLVKPATYSMYSIYATHLLYHEFSLLTIKIHSVAMNDLIHRNNLWF